MRDSFWQIRCVGFLVLPAEGQDLTLEQLVMRRMYIRHECTEQVQLIVYSVDSRLQN